jgi:hypothetical protein
MQWMRKLPLAMPQKLIFSCGILEDKFAYRLKEVAYNIYKYGQTNNYSFSGRGA